MKRNPTPTDALDALIELPRHIVSLIYGCAWFVLLIPFVAVAGMIALKRQEHEKIAKWLLGRTKVAMGNRKAMDEEL